MYHPFLQFVLPRVGQLALAGILYLNFLTLPVLQLFAATPLLYYGLPLVIILVLAWLARDPVGLGTVFVGYLTALYCLGTALALAARAAGGTVLAVWQAVWLQGSLPWLVVALVFLWGRHNAVTLRTTTYRLQTAKPLPGGRLRVVQISDIHPRPSAAMHKGRIPELEAKINACQPDILVLTGDIFDEYTPKEEFDAFCALFARLQAPLGKYFVLGNHDLFHHWQEPSFDRAALETAFAAAGIRILEDAAVLANPPANRSDYAAMQPPAAAAASAGEKAAPVRVVGRKDYLYTGGNRFAAAALLPPTAPPAYNIWLDHEPRDLKAAAAAGADLILCGHTHGGQIWPSGLVGRLAQNEMNYGAKPYAPHCTAIVSGGCGTWAYRLRTQGRTELVCVEVESRGKPAPYGGGEKSEK